MAGLKIKLCGMTRAEDARIASDLGADFIGMALHAPSRRRIDLDRAMQIMSVIGSSVMPVGMFVNASLEQIRTAASELGLTHVQLHGSESPEFAASLTGLKIFKAISMRDIPSLSKWKDLPTLAALLLDSTTSGGTGIENDWSGIRTLRDKGVFEGLPPVILAGGLTPQNVAGVVKLLKPWAVDVSSGIEESPGIKSTAKMEAFVRAAREAATLTS